MRTNHWAAYYLTNPNFWYPLPGRDSADGTTEHTEDEGLGVNICCSSASALCPTGNNDGKSWNLPSYLSVVIELWDCRDLCVSCIF